MSLTDFWKKFEDSELTHSAVHHLMAVYELKKNRGYARGVDVSKYLDITRGSAFITLKNLLEKGFLEEDENKFYSLTEKGMEIVNNVLAIRSLFIRFFTEVLNLPEKIAEEEACKIEHLISIDTARRLMSFLGFYLNDSPLSRQVREEYRRFMFSCTDDCSICETDCLFKGESSQLDPSSKPV